MNNSKEEAERPNLYKQSETVCPNSHHCLLSVIVPVKDEASTLGNLIRRIRESLCTYTYEIILVNDNSIDNTALVERSNDIVIVSHEKNLGKGTAMKTGAANAKGDILIFLDSDGVHDPRYIPNIIAPILQDKADLVIGSRALHGWSKSGCHLNRKLSNIVASIVISVVISFLLPLVTAFKYPLKRVKVTDCTSGFRAIRKEGWHRLNLTSLRFEIETEMIYEAASTGLTIAEVSITYNQNGQFSHLSILRDGLKTSKMLALKLTGSIGCDPPIKRLR
ncbi:glycosyltransferase family 2 protein [Chloroflexota bacterium]